MSKELETNALTHVVKWIHEYRERIEYSDSIDFMIKIQVTYWMEDIVSSIYYDPKYDISELYGEEIFESALTLKIYKILRDLHITYMGWNFDTTNKAIDDIGNYIFNKYGKIFG